MMMIITLFDIKTFGVHIIIQIELVIKDLQVKTLRLNLYVH